MWGRKNSNIGAQFSVLWRITLGPVETTPQNVSTCCAAENLDTNCLRDCTLKIAAAQLGASTAVGVERGCTTDIPSASIRPHH